MINALKKLLFGRSRSSLNLFMVMPILAFVSVCCICPGSSVKPRTCITSDGENLVWAGSKLLNIRLADGGATVTNEFQYDNVWCSENNEVVRLRENSVYKNDAYHFERGVWWRNAAKSTRLADIEFFQKTIGIVENRYFISGSRGFVEKSRSSGKSSVRYNYYDQPQVFHLEDSTGGELKSHYLYREKLGVPESVLYNDLWFYPLNLDEKGTLVFAMRQEPEYSVSFYKIDMFDGKITRTGATVARPGDMRRLEQVVTDKTGKFVALVYEGEGTDGYSIQKLVNVINAETGQLLFSKYLRGVALNSGTPTLVFEEKSSYLAIFVDGFRLEPTRDVTNVLVFDLETGGEIADIDTEVLLNKPNSPGLIKVIGSDLLLNYSPQYKTMRDEIPRLCRFNFLTKQVVWDVELPVK